MGYRLSRRDARKRNQKCVRVAWSGVGIDLKTERPGPEQVRRAIQTLLRNPSYKRTAQRIQEDFRRHDAPTEAAMLLGQLAVTGQPMSAMMSLTR
jgi:UDP:flavonoid glycosyltransferase YjiC (YdhE family)